MQATVYQPEPGKLERGGREGGAVEMERKERRGVGGAPISPDASLADGLLLLGKITPLLVRSPRWLYYLHGRAFIWFQER